MFAINIPTEETPVMELSTFHLRLAGLVTVLMAFAMGSCGDGPEPVAPDSFAPPLTVAMSQVQDSVYWTDDVLEFEFEGDTIRWERDQEAATEVQIYVNDTLQFTVELLREHGAVVAARFVNPGEDFSFEADTSGDVVSVMGAGGCTPDHMNPECPEPEFHNPCTGLGYAFASSASFAMGSALVAFGGGLVGGLTAGASLPVSAVAAVNASNFAKASLVSAVAWVACMHGADDECDEEDEEECQPEETFAP